MKLMCGSEWFCFCSPSLSVWALGDMISEDRGTSLRYNCLWQASSHRRLAPPNSAVSVRFCVGDEHVVLENNTRRTRAVVLAWNTSNRYLSLLSQRSYLGQGLHGVSFLIYRELMIASHWWVDSNHPFPPPFLSLSFIPFVHSSHH